MFSKNQSGFSIIEGIIAIAVVAVLGLIGWTVYNHYSSKFAKITSQTSRLNNGTGDLITSTNQPLQTIDPNTRYFVIKEWGVRFKLPTDLTALEYKMTNFSDEPSDSYADFYTTQLASLVPECNPLTGSGYVGLGRLLRYPISNQQPVTGAAGLLTTFNGYNFYFGHDEAECPDSTTTKDSSQAINLLNTDRTELGNAVKSLEEAKSTYLDIKELGVKILLNASIEDAVFALHQPQPADGSKMVLISAQSLIDGETDGKGYCNPGALGFILETTNAPTYVNSSKPLPVDNKQLFKFGNTYYMYVWTQGAGGCDITPSGVPSDLFTTKLNGFTQAFQIVQPDN